MTSHFDQHIDEIRRLTSVCAARGMTLSENDAYDAWSDYSESFAAGWMGLHDDDDQLFSVIERHTVRRPGSDTSAVFERRASEHQMRHADDVAKIVEICASRGIAISHSAAYDAWSAYSDTMAAGWMGMDGPDDDVFATVSPHLPAAPAP